MIYTVRIDSFMSKSAFLSILPHVQHMHPQITLTIELKNTDKYRLKQYVTLEHKTRHKGPFFEIEIYTIIHNISIDVWFMKGQYL